MGEGAAAPIVVGGEPPSPLTGGGRLRSGGEAAPPTTLLGGKAPTPSSLGGRGADTDDAARGEMHCRRRLGLEGGRGAAAWGRDCRSRERYSRGGG
ncbi:Os04g0187700 [Oryza sativa Japonica Group]|uniref:Os04g0187700 protein n=1 Tax=Oryza sativa subsp. japonica TaxID=39947 RepID=A0A0P0W781_ORYSJ|nr:Os04g0187700 [Oryza sativa Japonica Group]